MLSPQVAASLIVRVLRPKEVRVLRAKSPVVQAIDARIPQFALLVRYAFARGRKAVDRVALKSATTAEEAYQAMIPGLDAMRAALLDVLPVEIARAQAIGGQLGANRLNLLLGLRAAAAEPNPGQELGITELSIAPLRSASAAQIRALAPLGIRFDVANPKAVDWAREHATELIDGLDATSRQAVREAIADGIEDSDLSGAFDVILEAIGDDARAEVIARTEAATAINEGQRQAWDQAVEKGLLSEDAVRVWITTPGCCDLCEQLDGETAPLNGSYPSPGEDGPPLHPNCRCTEGIR